MKHTIHQHMTKIFHFLQKNLGSTAGYPTFSVEALKTHVLIWECSYLRQWKQPFILDRISWWTWKVYKRKNFEEIQSLFNITQKWINGAFLRNSECEYDRQCIPLMVEIRIIKWKISKCRFLTKNLWESMEKQLNSSDIISQDFHHCRFFKSCQNSQFWTLSHTCVILSDLNAWTCALQPIFALAKKNIALANTCNAFILRSKGKFHTSCSSCLWSRWQCWERMRCLFRFMWCHSHLTIILCCTVVWAKARGLEHKTSLVIIVHFWFIQCLPLFVAVCWWEQYHDIATSETDYLDLHNLDRSLSSVCWQTRHSITILSILWETLRRKIHSL